MTKAIATPPGQPTSYVELTTAEQTQRGAEEAAYLAEKPMNDWRAQMQATDANIPRWAEDIMDALEAPTRARIALSTMDKYNNKKALRLMKPL